MKLLWFILLFSALISSASGQVKINPEGKFFDYKGTKIYYEDKGSGAPLLLLHNFNGTADQWRPYVEIYSRQFRTIAVDMIGHGRSDIYKKGDVNFRPADYAVILIALLDTLRLYHVNAIGGSTGGSVLLHLNTMQPDRFDHIITIGAQYYYSNFTRELITSGEIGRAHV